jgi:hypothetical protein
MIELELNQRFKFVLRNTQESDESNEFSYKEMCIKLSNNPRLIDKIIPKNFNVGCRRPTPGNGFLECLVGEKTTCYTENIGGITPNGFLTADGSEVEVDVIICATGFDTSFRPQFPIIGLDGIEIAEKWKELPRSYAAVGVPKVPNYFMYSGPYGPVAQGSVLPLLTLGTKHFMQVIKKMRKEHIRRLSPKEGPTRDFGEHADVYLKRTAWDDPCSSWFKQGTTNGPLVMWPGSRLAFFDVMAEPKYEDYEIEYVSGNRWGYLGNGFTTDEFDGGDVTFYLNADYLENHLGQMKNVGEKITEESVAEVAVPAATVNAEATETTSKEPGQVTTETILNGATREIVAETSDVAASAFNNNIVASTEERVSETPVSSSLLLGNDAKDIPVIFKDATAVVTTAL